MLKLLGECIPTARLTWPRPPVQEHAEWVRGDIDSIGRRRRLRDVRYDRSAIGVPKSTIGQCAATARRPSHGAWRPGQQYPPGVPETSARHNRPGLMTHGVPQRPARSCRTRPMDSRGGGARPARRCVRARRRVTRRTLRSRTPAPRPHCSATPPRDEPGDESAVALEHELVAIADLLQHITQRSRKLGRRDHVFHDSVSHDIAYCSWCQNKAPDEVRPNQFQWTRRVAARPAHDQSPPSATTGPNPTTCKSTP
jgi:hypothetical protein